MVSVAGIYTRNELDKLLDEIQSNLTILENLAHGAEDRKTLAALDAQQVQATNEERLELAEACSKDVAFKKALEEYAGSQSKYHTSGNSQNFHGQVTGGLQARVLQGSHNFSGAHFGASHGQ